MAHGGDAARPAAVDSTELGVAQVGEAPAGAALLDGQLGVPAARRGGPAYHNYGEIARQTLFPAVRRVDGLVGVIQRDPRAVHLGLREFANYQVRPAAGRGEVVPVARVVQAGPRAVLDASGNLGLGAGDPGPVYGNLLPLVGTGACSVAVSELAGGPGSAAVVFGLFALLFGGLFLIILHVLRA